MDKQRQKDQRKSLGLKKFNQKRFKHNGRHILFWLPNLITLIALFLGFQSIYHTIMGNFEVAIYFLLIAMIADALDGRVARLLGEQSDFGASFDSIADIVSFGVAPALMIYQYALVNLDLSIHLPFLPWAVAFIFLSCSAFRLARFTATVVTTDNKFFQGIPSPFAALVITTFVGVTREYTLISYPIEVTALIITLILGYLMVSKIPYYSFKDIRFTEKIKYGSSLFYLVLLMVAMQVIYVSVLFEFLAFVCSAYLLSPLYGYLRRLIRKFAKN